jgi:hypothetical protein
MRLALQNISTSWNVAVRATGYSALSLSLTPGEHIDHNYSKY